MKRACAVSVELAATRLWRETSDKFSGVSPFTGFFKFFAARKPVTHNHVRDPVDFAPTIGPSGGVTITLEKRPVGRQTASSGAVILGWSIGFNNLTFKTATRVAVFVF